MLMHSYLYTEKHKGMVTLTVQLKIVGFAHKDFLAEQGLLPRVK